MFDNRSEDPFRAPLNDREGASAENALYVGLRDLPTPEPSADFDARILAALVRRPPWWQVAWSAARPALPSAACALTIMLALLHLSQKTPLGLPSPRSADITRDMAQRSARAQGGTPQESSLESMDSIDLNSASLSFFSHPLRRNPIKPG